MKSKSEIAGDKFFDIALKASMSYTDYAALTAAATEWATKSYEDGIDAKAPKKPQQIAKNQLHNEYVSAKDKVEAGDFSFNAIADMAQSQNALLGHVKQLTEDNKAA